MKVLHFSDVHGNHLETVESLLDLHRPDWIVITGDVLPDFYFSGSAPARLTEQNHWWSEHRNRFLRPDAVTTLTLGNHEIEGFRDHPLEEVPKALAGRIGILVGNPAEFGAWGFAREFNEEQLQREVDALNQPQVILSHCPPFGWLDRSGSGEHIGHRPLRDFIEAAPRPPILVLCGHVHQAFGELRWGGTLVVNAAEGYALIDLDLGQGVARVSAMASFEDFLSGGAH